MTSTTVLSASRNPLTLSDKPSDNQRMSTNPTPAASSGDALRRGDLDALRGVAMLLGIGLHASLAYFSYPWPVQDSARSLAFGLAYAAIHGFRMPLFFLLSGFFTMLVYRRRGLRTLLEQRALRLLLPLLMAMATILPVDRAVIGWAIRRSTAATAARDPLSGAILSGDIATVRQALAAPKDLLQSASQSGLTPLAFAATGGDPEIVAALLAAGAEVAAGGPSGTTPLHAATFMGRHDAALLLLANGADPAATNSFGKTPLGIAMPPGVAAAVGEFLGFPRLSAADIELGRRQIRALLSPLTPAGGHAGPLDALTAAYRDLLASPRLGFDLGGESWQLFETNFFDHLWFLVFLAWLVAAFALASVVGLLPTGRFRWWLLPASVLPAALMWSPYGPDTALGLLPTPHLLLYYGCFFWFGAATHAVDGPDTPLGARWPILLPLALLVLFPAGIATLADRPLAALLQPAYAWAMSIGLIGLFRRLCPRPVALLRWLADASYWMYLVHVPLVIACQSWLGDLDLPAAVKFLLVNTLTVAVLLLTYRFGVRYTPIGWLLHGPRTKPEPAVKRG
jgi:peptidoglycan/LPS O-acetylase OafA/YrhL